MHIIWQTVKENVVSMIDEWIWYNNFIGLPAGSTIQLYLFWGQPRVFVELAWQWLS